MQLSGCRKQQTAKPADRVLLQSYSIFKFLTFSASTSPTAFGENLRTHGRSSMCRDKNRIIGRVM